MIGRFSRLGVPRELIKKFDFYRICLGGAFALAAYLFEGKAALDTPIGISLALASVILNGVPILKGAVEGLIKRRVNVDELVSIAVIASLVEGEFLTAAVVSFVMVLGSLIEQATSESARHAIRSLMEISPKTATVIVDGEERIVNISAVKNGDSLLVKPGERVPVDGSVIDGMTAVDESPVTGEPIPVEKKAGDEIYAGTLNQTGAIRVMATRVGEDSTLGRVIRLVSEAEAHKPRAIRLIDRYARWFTPLILTFAGAAWILTGDTSRAIAVLIVGCPCALILAAPTAIVATIGRLARSGILVKGGLFIEVMSKVDVMLFDKTGTLTEGKPEVDEIVSAEGFHTDEVLARAASVEKNSNHPLARAVLDAANRTGVRFREAEGLMTRVGLGVSGRVDGALVEVGTTYLGGGTINLPQRLRRNLEVFKQRGATPIVVYQDSSPIGIISVSDHVRKEAKQTIMRLRSMGISQTGLLTGDHEKSARLVAGSVGLSDVWYGQSPEEKLKRIRSYQEEGSIVAFAGDGINDAPALATANVGIAMGAAGTDIALETADIALMMDDISKIPFLVALSRRMLKIIVLNIVFGMIFNLVAVLASGIGVLTPIMGAVVHNIGSVLVVLSSASLSFVRESNGKIDPPETS
ncbi:MAG: heavy metal translocating P-type ATPase [Deltaproteobacteria bacterium]|nr:heavy metal translocating P-type ATPase [Deltaproteobacteria bacterium]